MKKIVISILTLVFATTLSAGAQGLRNDSRADKVSPERVQSVQQVQKEVNTRVQSLRADAKETLQAKRNEFRNQVQETRTEFKAEFERKRLEAKEMVNTKREELRERVQVVKDEKKQEIILRLADRMNELNEKFLGRSSEALERLERILANIQTRADKAEEAERDVSGVESAVREAESRIAAAREAIKVQADKTYSFEIDSEEGVKAGLIVVKNGLRSDLEVVRDAVHYAKEGVRGAASALKEIPDVDDIKIEESDAATPEDSDSEENEE